MLANALGQSRDLEGAHAKSKNQKTSQNGSLLVLLARFSASQIDSEVRHLFLIENRVKMTVRS
jgi:hypothetical protein